ncbi:hypothetical protein C1H46_006460 [Malus baccata]|uniref:Uncharacterized protein n=1 Tax=Malus baccata TaxID=106549 RepID=A0A540NA53_MALBA|nr:hypothetical protein C1H46_006460 [Malus baccata]
MNSTNYALSDKAARNFRKAASCMCQVLTRLRETDGWNRRFDRLPVIFAELKLRVTGDNTSGRIDLAKPGVEKRIRRLRKEPRLFDLREDASSISEERLFNC